MRTLAPALAVLLALTASAQEPASRPKAETEQRVFAQAEHAGEGVSRSFFTFSAGGHDYTFRGDGYGESRGGRARPRPGYFNLQVDRGHLEQVYFLEYEGDLLLIYEVTDGARGWGYAARLSPAAARVKWLTGISGFNFGPALVESGHAYLTAAGLLAKLDLGSGAYVWRQQLRPDKDSPPGQVFQAPRVEGDQVFFTEDTAPHRTFVAAKLDGKIVAVRD